MTAMPWGAALSPRYDELVAPLRPLLARIRAGAVGRELERRLPVAEIRWLVDGGIGALRVPLDQGGAGANLPELFELLIEVAAADSNLAQALRGHLGFAEDVLGSPASARRDRWLRRLAAGELVGPAWSEAGPQAARDEFATRLVTQGDGWQLDGTKFYTTGSLYADWIDVGVTGPDGESLSATVRRDAPGVTVVDDWNGFGQTLTASGTAHFSAVAVAAEDVIDAAGRWRYAPAFYQLVHLATLAGIGRALASEVAAEVARRTRSYSNGNAPRVAQDPQILQVVGRLQGAAYAAGALVAQNARTLQLAYEARLTRDEAQEEAARIRAELETAQAQTVVSDLILQACTEGFDALGASATLKPLALDRFWRNARTLASHNPRVYKQRIVGDFAVNGTPPPEQWRIGVA